MGRSSDPWRTFKARNQLRIRTNNIKHHQEMQATKTAIANVANFFEEPHARHIRHRLFYGAHSRVHRIVYVRNNYA